MPQAKPSKVGIEQVSLELPDLTLVEQAAKAALEHHKSYQGSIDCPEVYSFVGRELLAVKAQSKNLKAQEDQITNPLATAKRNIQLAVNNAINLFKPSRTYLDTSEKLLKGELQRWEAVEERRIQEERRQAAIKQEEERRRQEAEARRRTEEAEAEARERQRLADEATRAGREAEARQLVKESEQIIESAMAQNEMEEEIAEITAGSAMAIQADIPKTAGIASKRRWVAEFKDLRSVLVGLIDGSTPVSAIKAKVNGKIVAAASANPAEVEAYIIPRSWFTDAAADQGEAFNYIGVRAFEKRETAVSA